MSTESDEPDGFFIMHCRVTDNLYFGPFETLEEAKLWWIQHPEINGPVIPLYKTINWARRG